MCPWNAESWSIKNHHWFNFFQLCSARRLAKGLYFFKVPSFSWFSIDYRCCCWCLWPAFSFYRAFPSPPPCYCLVSVLNANSFFWASCFRHSVQVCYCYTWGKLTVKRLCQVSLFIMYLLLTGVMVIPGSCHRAPWTCHWNNPFGNALPLEGLVWLKKL